MSTASVSFRSALAPVTRRVRAYFAPVARVTGTPTLFDPAANAVFNPDAPPAPWLDLGWVQEFTRASGTKVQAVLTGAPSGAQFQAREAAGATVSFVFEQWTKLTMALAAGSQHMNVLAAGGGASAPSGSGSQGAPAVALASAGSTAEFLQLSPADLSTFSAGCMVVVDTDYAGQTGFVGAGVSAAYVNASAAVQNSPDYIRRVSFNVGRVTAVTSDGLQLAAPLIAGLPGAGMRVQRVTGFVDREGGSFFHEWSALFAMAGEEGDTVLLHYPRLQATAGPAESEVEMLHPLRRVLLNAQFRAMPVVDGVDGGRVFCFRTYLPSANALI